MDADRRVATMDLLRRFGSEVTLSASSLVFNPDPGHFSDSEASISPTSGRFYSMDDDEDEREMVVSKAVKIKPVSNFKRTDSKERSEASYGKMEWSKQNNGIKPTASFRSVLPDSDINSASRTQMVANLNALSHQLAARNNQNHVHFPTNDAANNKVGMTKGISIGNFSTFQPVPAMRSSTSSVTPRDDSFKSLTETELHPTDINSTSHMIAEVSKHMSVLYCILLTITSASLSISATLTHNMDGTISRWFNSAMLAVGILWLCFAFLYLFRKPKTSHKTTKHVHVIGHHHYDQPEEHFFRERFVENDVDSGSFYLKMGATAFAIGSMIYACLELGVFVENTSCFSWVMGFYPSLFIIYVLLQLYFIFKHSQFKITGCRALSRFGLAHLVATDICVWIRTLLDETVHEFTQLKQKQIKEKGGNMSVSDFVVTAEEVQAELEGKHLSDTAEGFLSNGYRSDVCVDGDSMMHEMLETASMFLYPCMIEYALITAGIVYIMWHSVGKPHPGHGDSHHPIHRRHPRMFSVDCSHAANGLFAGVLIIVLTIVGLIFYFLYINSTVPGSDVMAGLCADILDVSLNTIGLSAVLYCAFQFFRKLQRVNVHNANMELDDGLLILTMIGVYAYAIMNIIGTIEGEDGMSFLSVMVDILELIQTTVQTVFIFDASKRHLMYPNQARRNSDRRQSDPNATSKTPHLDKPGREMLTLLLAVNFGQWAIDIMCTLRAETNTVPKEFFGTQQWAVLLHVTVPLVIFYRFHSTVCLFDIWKHAYKNHRQPHPVVHKPEA